MFRVELHELLYIYGGICLSVIFLAAFVYNARRAAQERAARKDVLKCRLCAFEFRDSTGDPRPRCPNCQAETEYRRLSRL